MEEIDYYPTEQDKKEIIDVCNWCIETLKELKKPEKIALALAQLTESFKETYNIDFTAIIEKHGKDNKIPK